MSVVSHPTTRITDGRGAISTNIGHGLSHGRDRKRVSVRWTVSNKNVAFCFCCCEMGVGINVNMSKGGNVNVNVSVMADLSLLGLRWLPLRRVRWSGILPYVWFPKYGAIPPLRPFRLFDSSFESSWRLKSYSTSLNVQIGVVVEL